MRTSTFWKLSFGAATVLSASLVSAEVMAETRCTRYVVAQPILDAPSCTRVDVSADRTRLYARINYAPNDDGFRIFDLTTGNYDVIADHHIPGVPWAGLVSWDHQHVWATRYYGGYLCAFNLATEGIECELDVGSWTAGLGFDSLRKCLYVGENDPGTCGSDGSIVKVDTTCCTCGGECAEAGRVTLDGEPGRCIQVAFGDEYVFAIGRCPGIEALYKIRTADMEIVGTTPLPGIRDAGFSLSPDGATAYVAHEDAQQVYVVNTDNMQLDDIWEFEGRAFGPTGFFVSPDGTRALVLGSDPLILVFDVATEEVYQEIDLAEYVLVDIEQNKAPPYWDCPSHSVFVPFNAANGGVIVLKEAVCPWSLTCGPYVGIADLAELLAHYGETCP